MKSRSTAPQPPKYLQIADVLRRQIAAGALGPGERLPSLAEFNAQFGISQATVDRVHAVLEREGLIVRRQGSGVFVSDRQAESARLSIGYIGATPSGAEQLPYWSHLGKGISQAAHAANADVLLCSPQGTIDWEKMEGALIHADRTPEFLRGIPIGMPRVLLMLPVAGMPSVIIDESSGLYSAVKHLLDLGHRRIAFLTSGDATPHRRWRVGGYQRAFEEMGLRSEPEWVRDLLPASHPGHFRGRGRDSMRGWLLDGWEQLRCTALLVHNDQAALGAFEVLREVGIRIPEDLSLVGYDGTEEGSWLTPQLTSVGVPLEKVGECAVDLLLRQIREERLEQPVVTLKTELVVRDSTAPPKTG